MSDDVNVSEYLKQSTENLVLMTLAGKQRAYEALVLRYERVVMASAMQIVKSEYMAQDAAQDAFVTAWLKLDTLASPEKFGQWVAKIARNSALGMAQKFRDYIDIDSFTGYESCFAVPFEDSLSSGDDYTQLHSSINSLTDKVKKVICLYYFEGLSISQIAAQMSISEGTVKRQLHDGRQKIRKDLCSMNETIDDTLVERVMKKVAEFCLYWWYQDDKTDFVASYKPLLEEVEALPESEKKNHALADILQLGWWYSDDKSDEALARLKQAALNGKNEDAMQEVMSIEHDKLSGKDKIEYAQSVQLPYLEENGFTKTQAYVWFWMGYAYINADNPEIENAAAAFNKTLELLEPQDIYYANALSALKLCRLYSENRDNLKKQVCAVAYDLRMYNGELKLYSQPGFSLHDPGYFSYILYYAVRRLDILTCKAGIGETVREQGHSATLVSTSETVDTPAGRFEGCELWQKDGISFYIKPGVGIVKSVSLKCYDCGEVVLDEYNIKSGSGKMPLGVGNSWKYVSSAPECIDFCEEYEVIFSEGSERAVLSSFTAVERVKYDENSWNDIKLKLAADYNTLADRFDNDDRDSDGSMRTAIFNTLKRMQELAKTTYQKLVSDRADSTTRRMLTSSPNLSPDCKEVSIWNFFKVCLINSKDGVKSLDNRNYYHFEWKQWYGAAYMLLHNFMLEELNNCGAVWDDVWKPGYSAEKTLGVYNDKITASITCEDGGTVTTAAGTFENCLKLTIDYSGFDESRNYMNGKKEYFFANGIGIVKCIHHIGWAVYELESYEGTGEGYMPLEEGISRHYKGVDFPYSMRGEVDFVCVTDDNGQLMMIVDQTGQQNRADWNNSDQPKKWHIKK